MKILQFSAGGREGQTEDLTLTEGKKAGRKEERGKVAGQAEGKLTIQARRKGQE